jgi:PilZ domain
VTDPITTSKSARESLARGLNALQADPSVPPALVELASPIAQAMGALHQIERTQQLAPHADLALNHLRGALAQLQTQHANHPAVNQALEAVASSLSLVHSLSRMANGPQGGNTAQPPGPLPSPPVAPPAAHFSPPAAPPPAAAPPAAPPAGPVKTQAMAQKAPVQAAPQQPPPQAHAPYAPPQQQQPPQQRMSNPQPSFPQQHSPSAPQQSGPGMVARDPFAAPQGPPPGGPIPGLHMPSGGGPLPATPSMPVPAPPAGNLQLVNADLGAHSATNFFKGLSGNDIIDHGGLFVSTYILPKIGHPVRLKVSLPGGYEFEANAVVKWTREDGGGDAPPGFGAQFTQITPEARQLVYRYVRNREPMFYDDL